MRCIEFYSGIGGFAVAASQLDWQVVRAYEINRQAVSIYAENFPHPVEVRTIESIRRHELAALDAELWWMSPPCQPFTRRGARRDIADKRSTSFLKLIDLIAAVRPQGLVLENVPGFRDSIAAARLRDTLDTSGYLWQEEVRCPTQLGVPNRRARYYIIASRDDALRVRVARMSRKRLANYLEHDVPREFDVQPGILSDYQAAVDIVRADDPLAVTSCFTAAYGKSPIRSGSYLRQAGRVRRFSPREVASLLGYPLMYRIPQGVPSRTCWKLLGNSLSIPTVVGLLESFRLEST